MQLCEATVVPDSALDLQPKRRCRQSHDCRENNRAGGAKYPHGLSCPLYVQTCMLTLKVGAPSSYLHERRVALSLGIRVFNVGLPFRWDIGKVSGGSCLFATGILVCTSHHVSEKDNDLHRFEQCVV
jgi:hypothetical protein